MLRSHDGAKGLVMLQNTDFVNASKVCMSLVKGRMQENVACTKKIIDLY